MPASTSITPRRLSEFLLHVAPVRPVFIWGPLGTSSATS